jgi:hypothetical protein
MGTLQRNGHKAEMNVRGSQARAAQLDGYQWNNKKVL